MSLDKSPLSINTASDAKHILLIVDSCFSGSLTRGSGENKSIEKLTQTTLRNVIGELELDQTLSSYSGLLDPQHL